MVSAPGWLTNWPKRGPRTVRPPSGRACWREPQSSLCSKAPTIRPVIGNSVSFQFLNGLFVGWSEGPISDAYRLSELHYVIWRRNRNPAVAQRLDAPGSLPLLSVDMAGG